MREREPVRPDYLDAAADIFAVAKVYDDQGDPELLRRVEARIVRDGYTVEQVRERVREKANAAISGAGNSQESPRPCPHPNDCTAKGCAGTCDEPITRRMRPGAEGSHE